MIHMWHSKQQVPLLGALPSPPKIFSVGKHERWPLAMVFLIHGASNFCKQRGIWRISKIWANMEQFRSQASAFVVWRRQVWNYDALGSIFSSKFWQWVVLVSLERREVSEIRQLYEEELSPGIFVCWFCTNVHCRIFRPKWICKTCQQFWCEVMLENSGLR